jgi:hypothetical protein
VRLAVGRSTKLLARSLSSTPATGRSANGAAALTSWAEPARPGESARTMQAADYAAMPRAAEYVKSLSAADLQADAACSGWLRKRSEHVKQWNKRWFVLWPKVPQEGQGRLLVYYGKPNDEQARGVYRLHPGEYSLQTEQTKKHKVCLVLTTNKPNKWDEIIDRIVLSVDDVEKAVDWARAINSTGIAAQKKERKAPPTAQLGAGLGNIIEECDEDEEEESEEESDDESATSTAGSEASSRGSSPFLGASGVREGIPPLKLEAEPEPEPELEPGSSSAAATQKSTSRIRLLSSKSASGLPLDESAPVRRTHACYHSLSARVSILRAATCPVALQRLSPSASNSPASSDMATAEGGDKAFGLGEAATTGLMASRWRKAGRRGGTEGELLEERRPSISVTGLDYNSLEEQMQAQQQQQQEEDGAAATSASGTPRQAVAVLGLKPWNANRASNAPMHLDLQIAKELKTLDWSPGVRKDSPKAAAAGGGGAAFSDMSGRGGGGGEQATSRSASAPELHPQQPAAAATTPRSPSLSPSTSPASAAAAAAAGSSSRSSSRSPPVSPAKAVARGGGGGGGLSGDGSGGSGRTLAAALRSSIGGSTPENKALQEALLRAGGAGDVRSVLAVMSEYVNGVNGKLKEMESESAR